MSGFFGPREGSWKEPIDRNFSGLLRDFGAQELAMLVAPRALMVEDILRAGIDTRRKWWGTAEIDHLRRAIV